MKPVLIVASLILAVSHSIPVPQLTEEEFNARARSLDFDQNVFMIEGYSQVRRQGGRAVQEPIKFPTLTVKNPNLLPVDGTSKVRVSLANPVYKEELNSIAEQINAINELEGARIDSQELDVIKEAMESNGLEIVEVTTKKQDSGLFDYDDDVTRVETTEIISQLDNDYTEQIDSQDGDYSLTENTEESVDTDFNQEPTTQTLEIMEVTKVDKDESEAGMTTQILEISEPVDITESNDMEIMEVILESTEEPILVEEMSLDIEEGDEIKIAPLQTEELLIEEVTTIKPQILEIKEV